MVLVTCCLTLPVLPIDWDTCFLGVALKSTMVTSSGLSLTNPANKSSSTGADERCFHVGAMECLPTVDFFRNNDLAAKPLQAMMGQLGPVGQSEVKKY